MFATPNDDNHFMLFTVERYTGPDADFFRKLAETRLTAKTPKKKDYDHRTYAPFRENVRQEDIVTQGTQGSIDQREEHLAVSDRAIILLRKSILNAIKEVQRGELPQGVVTKDGAEELVKIDSFTGIRTKGIF